VFPSICHLPRRSRNRSGRGPNERRYWPFKNPSAPFRDIVASIRKIERFVAGIDLVAFSEDEKQFLLWSESCRKLASETPIAPSSLSLSEAQLQRCIKRYSFL
jgi:hypothetical protein